MTPEMLVGHLEYNRWATDEILKLVEPLPAMVREEDRTSSHGGILGTLVHHYQGDAVWFDRMRGKPTGGPENYPVPEQFEEFAAKWREMLDEWVAWGQQQPADSFLEELDYKNYLGQPFRSPVWQMLLTVVNHGSYHRGQVVTMLRQAGYKAVGTDLIVYYRSVRGA